MLQFKINKDGYIEEFMMPGGIAVLPDGIQLENYEDIDLEDFEINFKSYKFDGEKLFRDDDILQSVIDERENNELRNRRERECFSVINRGSLWYSKLSESELNELNEWYQKWLDVTDTNVVPTKPLWLK